MKPMRLLVATAILTIVGLPDYATMQWLLWTITKNCPECDLRGVNLTDANLRGADLREADLRGAKLLFVDLNYADLRGANLRGAYLNDVTMKDTNLCKAILPDGTKSTIGC